MSEYICEGTIVSMRKCLHKKTSTSKKTIKFPTNIATQFEEIKSTIGLM